ncbi:phage terminase large subunit [Chryseobacterium arthrosphaerae]|uniref:phage terminase large subunit n=1 Tax=Chryseobacterium arthrosphaerae TaxID=651561 RepID=UPI00241ED64A|nr:phage terminase large subunit [Chryseobacterium arthrosphaerae]
MKKFKYGVTEVFAKHDFYASLRIRLFNEEGRIFIDSGDEALPTDEFIKIPEKRYAADKLLTYESGLLYSYCGKEDIGAFPRYKYIIHEGSSRSSKSWSLEEWVLREAEITPNLHINIWRDSREALTDTIWKDFRKLIPLSGRNIRMNRNTTPIAFKNGSIISPKGADQTNAHGTTQDIAWLNEPYKIGEDEFDQIDQRSNQVIIDINPVGLYWAEKLVRNPRCKVIYSTFRDNPFCPAGQKMKILGYEPWESGSYEVVDGKIMYHGKPVTEKHQPPVHKINKERKTINKYKWIVYGLGLKAENPRRIHQNFSPITREDYDRLEYMEFMGVDYGSSSPSALVKIKFDGDRSFYILPCLYRPINQMKNPLGEELIAAGAVVGNKSMGWADSSDSDPGSDMPLTNGLRTNYNLNLFKTKKPTYKARFDFMSNALFYYVEEAGLDDKENGYDEKGKFEYELDRYQWEYINNVSTEKPIKKDDHYMNATEYCVWGIKEYYDIHF